MLDWEVIRVESARDEGLGKIRSDLLKELGSHPRYLLEGDKLLYQGKFVMPWTSIYIPNLLQEFHGSAVGGHSSVQKTHRRRITIAVSSTGYSVGGDIYEFHRRVAPLRGVHGDLSGGGQVEQEVLKKIGAVAYRLKLPPAATIHPIFHVSQLRKAIGDYTANPELPGTLTEDLEMVLEPIELEGICQSEDGTNIDVLPVPEPAQGPIRVLRGGHVPPPLGLTGHMSFRLLRLAVYHDNDSVSWNPGKSWEDLNPADWSEIFQDGIGELDGDKTVSLWAKDRRYLVSPINGVLKYHRLGKQERQNPQIPFEKASLSLTDVSLTVSEAQYYDGIKLLEAVSTYKTRVEVSHLRPVVSIFEDPHAWWRYAMLASMQQKKLCYWLSWERIKHLCQLRRCYVQIYASSLQQTTNTHVSSLRQIERILDSKVILLWRLLAHAKLESVKSKESSQQKSAMKRSWWSFGWSTSSGDSSAENNSSESQLVEEEMLIREEWKAINKLLSYQPDEGTFSPRGKDIQNMIQVLVDVSIAKAAARIISINHTEIVCGSFEQLNLTTKMYHRSIHCDVSLKCYGLSSPEGQLSQSVSSERKKNALEASFVHAPVGEDVDWRLSAAIAPCYVTILMESYVRFMEFVKRSNAISPTVTMETATALQMKIEQVTRKAQEQLQMVLEEKSRFSLDVDFDAPKVRIPMRSCQSSAWSSQFLLDFGHFTLHTREGQLDDHQQSLYSRFYISGRDMSAIFIDGDYSENCMVTVALDSRMSPLEKQDNDSQFYSLLDRCGMSVIVDLIKIPHARYPSTRISVQVPNLGIHFSPERYSRILRLLNIFYGPTENINEISSGHLQTGAAPWLPADLATDARILVWKGFGHSLAEWKPCYIVLSGLYLYVLETQYSQTYQRCCSVSGRQVHEVSPSTIGGLPFVIAVSSRGMDIQKVCRPTFLMLSTLLFHALC
ncbi:putative vacuolar protein sorting-associated protein 13A [Dendrobium catenatum]|uniref:putative vacuolar protein sorting-associated protein 13A n=1 Tax=Dendrobium catenatum TaxID=906689 RepID=UPI0010A03C4B|nr:putative vacuolar protein sorting-associated protein 13A [Dendrobium catenatum]